MGATSRFWVTVEGPEKSITVSPTRGELWASRVGAESSRWAFFNARRKLGTVLLSTVEDVFANWDEVIRSFLLTPEEVRKGMTAAEVLADLERWLADDGYVVVEGRIVYSIRETGDGGVFIVPLEGAAARLSPDFRTINDAMEWLQMELA